MAVAWKHVIVRVSVYFSLVVISVSESLSLYVYMVHEISISAGIPPTPLLSSSCQTVIRSALWWSAQMPPEMQVMSLFCGLLCFFVFFMSAFCHLAFSSSWLTHVHGQCFYRAQTKQPCSLSCCVTGLLFMLALPRSHALCCTFIIYERMQSYFCWSKWNGNLALLQCK